MASGKTNAGIATRLVVSEGTVKSHVKHILRKLAAANRAEAVSVYLGMERDARRGRFGLSTAPLPLVSDRPIAREGNHQLVHPKRQQPPGAVRVNLTRPGPGWTPGQDR
jgi:hypothetical protein